LCDDKLSEIKGFVFLSEDKKTIVSHPENNIQCITKVFYYIWTKEYDQSLPKLTTDFFFI